MQMTPERIHLIVNHWPIVGFTAALIPLIVGLCLKGPATLRTGLAMVVLFSATVGMTMGSGEEAYERFEQGLITPGLDEAGNAWMHEHEHRAHAVAKLGYAAGGLAAVALLVGLWKPRWGRGLGVATVMLTAVAVGGLVWVADSGGKIRHPEARPAPAAAPGGAAGAERGEHGHDH